MIKDFYLVLKNEYRYPYKQLTYYDKKNYCLVYTGTTVPGTGYTVMVHISIGDTEEPVRSGHLPVLI
jgi:hypothetical protein